MICLFYKVDPTQTMPNFRLTIEYDGTAYHGWQRQKNERTIQEEIENALMTMTREKIAVAGSGRTDAGVHAWGQVANFRCDTRLTPEIFQKGLNSLLNKDIVIRECLMADECFHARYDAKSKTYQYRILNWPIRAAIHRQYAWFIRQELNIGTMRSALPHIMGIHDFKAFEGTGSPRTSTVRHVIRAGIRETKGDQILFDIEADGFLRYMVRNIVGTLVDAGKGRIPGEDVNRIFLSRDRNQAGATAPAKGLFLMKVNY